MKNNKGITLIALVITIIVLIVLAGISINAIMGENSVTEKAKEAEFRTTLAQIQEQVVLHKSKAMMDGYFENSGNTTIYDKYPISQTEVDKTQISQGLKDAIESESGKSISDVKLYKIDNTKIDLKGNREYLIDVDTLQIYDTEGKNINGKLQYTITGSGIATGKNDKDNITDDNKPPVVEDTADPATDSRFGNDTSKATWNSTASEKHAVLDLGETVNLRLKKIAALANGVSEEVVNTWTASTSEDTYITSIVWSETAPSATQIVKYGQLAMTALSPLGMSEDGTTNQLIISDFPIYAWYNEGIIYMWSEDTTIDLHPHSDRMFQGMKNLTSIPALSHFLTIEAKTVRYMFKDTKIADFTPCNDWYITNVGTELKENDGLAPVNNGFYWMCNGVPSNKHPNFTRRTGTWDSEGTFFDSTHLEKVRADVNRDGFVNMTDYKILDDYLNDVIDVTGLPFEWTDVDQNGVITRQDANIVLKYIDQEV